MAGRPGLYANINAKRKRIKGGSGEKMRISAELRPELCRYQWAMGRVKSFVSGKGGARKADSDLLKGKKKNGKKTA